MWNKRAHKPTVSTLMSLWAYCSGSSDRQKNIIRNQNSSAVTDTRVKLGVVLRDSTTQHALHHHNNNIITLVGRKMTKVTYHSHCDSHCGSTTNLE